MARFGFLLFLWPLEGGVQACHSPAQGAGEWRELRVEGSGGSRAGLHAEVLGQRSSRRDAQKLHLAAGLRLVSMLPTGLSWGLKQSGC